MPLTLILILDIFATQCRCKDIGIRKFEFVAKTQFLYFESSNKSVKLKIYYTKNRMHNLQKYQKNNEFDCYKGFSFHFSKHFCLCMVLSRMTELTFKHVEITFIKFIRICNIFCRHSHNIESSRRNIFFLTFETFLKFYVWIQNCWKNCAVDINSMWFIPSRGDAEFNPSFPAYNIFSRDRINIYF